MYPPAAADITTFWTEEEIFKSLEKIEGGSPLPANMTADVNPYLVMPSNLPEGIWYYYTEVNKKAQHGFWKATGDVCNIFSNPAMIGWRATLKFYEGLSPHEQRTNWVMQEYSITKKKLCQNNKPKVSGALCRVFMSDEKSGGRELSSKQSLADVSNINPSNCVPTTVPNADINTGQLSKNQSLEKNETKALSLADIPPDQLPIGNFEDDYILNEDYLELNDLVDPDSNSSSSMNSSFRTFTSEEYFDSVALLLDLEAENKDQQGKGASFKIIHSSIVKPNEVVIQPATVGSLASGDGGKSPTEGKGNYTDEGTPEMLASSSRSPKAFIKGEKKGLVGRMKRRSIFASCHCRFLYVILPRSYPDPYKDEPKRRAPKLRYGSYPDPYKDEPNSDRDDKSHLYPYDDGSYPEDLYDDDPPHQNSQWK